VNLAQLYFHAAEADREQIIENHLDKALALAQGVTIPKRFDEVRERLRVRLLPMNVQVAAPLVAIYPCEEFQAVVAIDLEGKIVLANEDMARDWGVPEEELFSSAVANTDRYEPVRNEIVAYGGPNLRAFFGPAFYTASHLLWLKRHIDDWPEAGVLAIAPNRGSLVAHEMRDASAGHAMVQLAAMARGMFAEGPGSISPCVFWLREGAIEVVPIEITDEGVRFEPGPEFASAIASLLG
jgi:hypothetical protein